MGVKSLQCTLLAQKQASSSGWILSKQNIADVQSETFFTTVIFLKNKY